MAVTYDAVSRFSAVDKFSGVLSKMEKANQKFASITARSMARVEKSIQRVQSRVTGFTSQFKQLFGLVTVSALFLTAGQAILEYDKQMRSLQAITGVTTEQMKSFKSEINKVAKDTGSSTIEIAKGFEIVGSKLPELLKNEKALADVTKAAVQLRQAAGFNIEVADSYTAVTSAINQFKLQASDSARVMNALAAGQQAGSAGILDLNASLEKGGKAAFDANVSLESFIAQAELLEPAGFRGAEAGTAMRNIWLSLANIKGLPKAALDKLNEAGVDMDLVSDKTRTAGERLEELQKLSKVTAGFMKVFGKENVTAAKTLIEHGTAVDDFEKKITGTQKGLEQAALNTDTLSFRLDRLKNSFTNAATAQTDGSIGLSIFAGLLDFAAGNMDILVGTVGAFLAIAIPVVAIWKTMNLIIGIHNTILAISALLNKKNMIALRGNAGALLIFGKITKVATIGQLAYNAVMSKFSKIGKIYTAVQTAMNAAMQANPIGAIIIAIIAIIAAIVFLVKHWDTLKEKFTNAPTWVKVALLPLIFANAALLILVNTIRKVIDHWDGIKRAFTDGSFADGLKKLGGVLLSALIDPFVFLLKLVAKLPGLGDKVQPFIDKVQDFQLKAEGGFGVDEKLDQQEQARRVNPAATQAEVQQKMIERSEQNVNVNIKDQTGRAEVDAQRGPVPVNVESTQDQF